MQKTKNSKRFKSDWWIGCQEEKRKTAGTRAQAASITSDPYLAEMRQYLTIFSVNMEQRLDKLIMRQVLTCINNFKSFSRKDKEAIVCLHIQAQGMSLTHKLGIIVISSLEALIYWVWYKERR